MSRWYQKRGFWGKDIFSNTYMPTLTCASSWITRYCSFQTVILETSSFLRARSFFNSGLQKVLIEFIEELSLLSLTSTSRRSISFSRRTWGSRIKVNKYHAGVVCLTWQVKNSTLLIERIKRGENKGTTYLFQLSLQVQYGVVSGLPQRMGHSGGHVVVPKS